MCRRERNAYAKVGIFFPLCSRSRCFIRKCALFNETFEMSKAQCKGSCDYDFKMYTYTTRNVCMYN